MNVNPNEPSKVPTSYLLTSAQKVLMAFMWDEWWAGRFGNLYSQYWSQASYTDESRYKIRDGVNNNYFIYFYSGRDANPPDGEINGGGMKDLQRIIELNEGEDTKAEASVSGSNDNQIAVARILKAWMFQVLTDTYGYIPYSQALNLVEYTSPAYDSQQDIYAGLIIELTEAAAQINTSEMGVLGDIIYGGDMAAWKKFAHSLLMRVGIRMADVNPAAAKKAIEDGSAGAFESNADNAWFYFVDGKPNNNPLNENQKTRSDFGVSKTLVDFLQARSDPRLRMFANEPNTAPGEFYGFPYGMTNGEATPISVDDVSMPSNLVYAPSAPGMYMNYDEVCFIMAEACANLGVAGSAEEWYYKGIEASMMMWNDILGMTPTGWYRIDGNQTTTLPDPITDAEMADYKAMPNVAWNAGNAAQLIAEQKYIALYPSGLQAWFEWRRTDYPKELITNGTTVDWEVAGGQSGTYTFTAMVEPGSRGIPKRMTYPADEQTLNGASYDAAVGAQGPDNFNTKTWWDPN